MAGSLEIAGAQPSKPPRYRALYTSRYFSGLVTQRSPLRSAGSAYEERYLGTRGDALIDGSNCEVTPKLTLARRPGNPVYNSNTFAAINAFYSFREFSSTTEQIRVMADTASILYDATANGQIVVFNKTAGSGQTFMQSVGNTLYFADGIDQKKWVQSLFTRTNSAAGSPNIGNSVTLDAAQFPFISTYLIDTNGNLQELIATEITTVTNVTYVSATNLLTLTVGSTAGITQGELCIIWDAATATWLNGVTFKVLTAVGTTVTANLLNTNHADYASTPETAHLDMASGGVPVTGGSIPSWNTTVPSSGNDFLGGITIDGTAVWMNRGNPVENWGLAAGTTAPTAVVGTSTSAWKAHTFFSLAGAVIDTQFGGQTNIWQVTVAGKSGVTNPFTSNPTSGTTTVTDGGVTWKNVASTHSGDSFWTAHTMYPNGHLIVEPAGASSVNSLFQLQYSMTNPQFVATAGVYINATTYPHNNAFAGQCDLFFGSLPGSTGNDTAGNSVLYNYTQGDVSGALQQAILNAAGEITGYRTPFPSATTNYNMVVVFKLTFPSAGQYTFNITHDDGIYYGISTGAVSGNAPIYVSGPLNNLTGVQATKTAQNGYTVYGGNNVSGLNADTYTVNIPTADTYTFEIDFCNWLGQQQLVFLCNGQTPVPGAAETSASAPVWPAFSTSFAPNYAHVNESANQYQWNNLGPITDAVWTASINYTLPDTTITDPNNNTEAPFRAGVSGTMVPTFATGINQLTNDNPNLIWINQGPASAPAPGTLSAFNGGFIYYVALANSATDTVSNASLASAVTGNFIGAAGVTITGGLPATANIDPQADYVAIFRTTDGQTTPFLIPGTTNAIFTVPLPAYLMNGYVDNTPDTGLNNLIEAPIAGENTPPALGAQALTYHLSRIFFSVGNTVYWTSGPDAPIGNGLEGVAPDNFATYPSLVKRIVPTTVGAFVFTVSDIYILVGQATSFSPIQSLPYALEIGILNYNALDVFGSSIGFYATDKTFNILDPSSGPSEVGFNIGDRLQVSPQWNAANVYVTWHASGEDKAWFVSDGATGWYRVGVTPSPEQGVTISPFATIVGGAKAVQSIETLPGTHMLLVGPTTSGPILARSLSTFTDNTSSYPWFAVVGSHVLANPGQLAEVAFITTDANAVGSRIAMSVILDEAVPTYTGPFEQIPEWVEDPPTLPASTSTYAQRFYLSQTQEPALCRHLQYRIDLPSEAQKNELYTCSIFGALLTEQ